MRGCATRRCAGRELVSQKLSQREARAARRYRRRAYRAQGGLCWWCGCAMTLGRDDGLPTKCTAEHLVRVADGGPTTPDNVVAACRNCNSMRHDHETSTIRVPPMATEWARASRRRRSPIAEVYAREEGVCFWCERLTTVTAEDIPTAAVLDPIDPSGWHAEPANLLLACAHCRDLRAGRDFDAFLDDIARLWD